MSIVWFSCIGVHITTALAGTHPVVGRVTIITVVKTESMICIKWKPPSAVCCGSTYKYLVEYKFDFHNNFIVVTECEFMLTNLKPDTHMKICISTFCTCPSRVFGKCARLIQHTCKLHMQALYIHAHAQKPYMQVPWTPREVWFLVLYVFTFTSIYGTKSYCHTRNCRVTYTYY